MSKKNFVLYFILLATCSLSFGQETLHYKYRFIGEQDNPDFYGALTPLKDVENANDETYFRNYPNKLIQSSIFNLNDFWNDHLQLEKSCPNTYFSQNYDYIRYLYRLLGISYLTEVMRENYIHAYQFGLRGNDCNIKWKDTFAQCKPSSEDMKTFLRRIKDRHLMGFENERLVKMNKTEIAKWLTEFKEQLDIGQFSSVYSQRLSLNIDLGQDFDFVDVRTATERACKESKDLLIELCSEKDSMYGFSDSYLFEYLLSKSNTINMINDGGYGVGCLKRFVRENKKRETKLGPYANVIQAVFEKIRKSAIRYKEGSIFIAGALKEFDEKGLKDFIFKPKPKPVKPKVVVAVAKPKPEPKPVVEKVVVKAKPVPKPVVAKPVPKKPEIKYGQFETARRLLANNINLKNSPVNMELFRDDFVFTKRMIKALKEPIRDFQTRQGLEDMKKWDKLGTYDEPVRLIFLKFLIDNNLHTGLFNIIAVLGDTFYVIDDIENNQTPALVKIVNDESTNFIWQIYILN